MKKLIALIALLDSSLAMGQGTNSPCYWAGTLAKCWPLTGIYLDDNRSLRLGEDAGNGSNYVELISPASLSGNGVLTMPAATDTLVGKATTDTLTNKTIDADGTGNSITNIENENIKASAAIAYSKLDLATSIVNADVSASAAIDGSKLVAATNAVAGVVTTAAQNIAGAKTFYDGIELDDDANQSALNYYREFTGTCGSITPSDSTGVLGNGATCTLAVVRVGSLATARITVTTGTAPSATASSTAAADSLPTWAQPAESLYCGGAVPINYANGEYMFTLIGSSGAISFDVRDVDDGTRNAGPASTGLTGFICSYPVDL